MGRLSSAQQQGATCRPGLLSSRVCAGGSFCSAMLVFCLLLGCIRAARLVLGVVGNGDGLASVIAI